MKGIRIKLRYGASQGDHDPACPIIDRDQVSSNMQEGVGPATLQPQHRAGVGRIVQGIEQLSSLPRGTETLGFYKDRSSDVSIVRARLASDLPAAEQPRLEYLGGASFNAYIYARKNRRARAAWATSLTIPPGILAERR